MEFNLLIPFFCCKTVWRPAALLRILILTTCMPHLEIGLKKAYLSLTGHTWPLKRAAWNAQHPWPLLQGKGVIAVEQNALI